MTESARLVQTGTVNGTPITVDVRTLGSAAPVKAQLTADYLLANPRPPGFPFRPFMTGAEAANLDYPRTLASGTVISVLQAEATALVNAGAATLL